jgi:hypothetical protein
VVVVPFLEYKVRRKDASHIQDVDPSILLAMEWSHYCEIVFATAAKEIGSLSPCRDAPRDPQVPIQAALAPHAR